MQDMVDDLLDERQPKQGGHLRPGSKEDVSKQTYTAPNLVRQIQKCSRNPSSQSQPKLSAGHSTASSFISSRLEKLSGSRTGSVSANELFKTPASPLRASSGHSLTNQFIRQQQEIQARSSPPQTLPEPSSWSYFDTSTGFNSILNTLPRSPSWPVSPTTPMETVEEEIKKPLPRRNLFAAIGNAKTPERTPTSGQPR